MISVIKAILLVSADWWMLPSPSEATIGSLIWLEVPCI